MNTNYSFDKKLADVFHVTTLHQRYDSRILFKECMSLSDIGYRVVLLVADGKGESYQGNIKIVDLGDFREAARWKRFLKGNFAVVSSILSERPRIAHFHDPELIPGFVILRFFGIKVVYDVHEDLPRQILSKEWIAGFVRTPMSYIAALTEYLAGKLFNGIVAATPLIADRFPRKKTVVVQNYPICHELVQARSDTVVQCKKRNNLVYIGGISRSRGILEIMEVLRRLPDELECRLNLCGEFVSDKLEEEVKSHPGWKKVDYFGWQDRQGIRCVLGSSRVGLVLLHPQVNYLDSYPIKMFEYMSAGLPVLASNFPLWINIIESNGCGMCVDPSDIDKIAESIKYLLYEENKAALMGDNGRKTIEERFNWSLEQYKLFELYNELLS